MACNMDTEMLDQDSLPHIGHTEGEQIYTQSGSGLGLKLFDCEDTRAHTHTCTHTLTHTLAAKTARFCVISMPYFFAMNRRHRWSQERAAAF